MSIFFKVLGLYKGIQDNGEEKQCKETFLIESVDFADSYYTALKLLQESTNSPDSIDVTKIDRQDKLTSFLYSDLLCKEDSVKEGMVELSVKDNDTEIYSIKVIFTIEDGYKIKKSTDIYFVPAESTTMAIKHVCAHLRNTTFDYKIADTKPTGINTVLLMENTFKGLVSDYDMIKHLLK